jgi:hypothetical protein
MIRTIDKRNIQNKVASFKITLNIAFIPSNYKVILEIKFCSRIAATYIYIELR